MLEDEQDYIAGLDAMLGVCLDVARGAIDEIAICQWSVGLTGKEHGHADFIRCLLVVVLEAGRKIWHINGVP
jgi:hypothetical protein